jgi:hypothetical protein
MDQRLLVDRGKPAQGESSMSDISGTSDTDYEAKKSLEVGRTVRQLGTIPFENHHLR